MGAVFGPIEAPQTALSRLSPQTLPIFCL